MRKIFTLLAGMLLACSLTSNAADVEVYIKDADSYTTSLTKDEDGNFVLADFLESEKPISFKFEKPAELYAKSAITITSKTTQDGNYYELLDANGKAIDCYLYNYKGNNDWLEIYYPSVYNKIANTFVQSVDPEEYDGYEYYAKMTIFAYDYDLTEYWIYVSFYFNDPSEANQAAYDKVIADIESIEAKYKDAVAGLEKEYEGIDLSEWDEIIGGQLAQVKSGAAQQLAAANSDLEDFNFPFDGEEYEGMIAQMQKDAPNLVAYQKVLAQINSVEEAYNEAVEAIKEVNPDFDFKDYKEIETQIEDAKKNAKTALDNANEDGEKFSFAFGAEDIEAYITEMKKAAFAEYNQDAYDKVLAEINAVETQYNDAVAAIKAGNPDFDFTEWSEIAVLIAQARSNAATAFELAEETGEIFNFPAGTEDIENFISEMKNADPKAYNKGAYDQVLAAIQGLEEEYNDAVEAIKEVNPEFDFADWNEIADQIAQAKEGAKQAFDSAEEDGGVMQYAFSSEGIEAYITEMKKAAFAEYNQDAYDKVLAEINAVETQYNDAVAAIKAGNPDFDFTEWSEIANMIAQARSYAAKAFDLAEETGEIFNFPAGTEDIENFISEMKNADPKAYNKGAYDQVLAAIQGLEEEYNDAVEAIKEVNPEFNFAEWSEIADLISQAKEGAKQAFDSAEEDGEVMHYAYSLEGVEAYITEMKKAAFAEYNQKAYDKVIAEIEDIEAKYEAAVAEIEKEYPEFKLDEWKEIIGKPLEEAKKGADQALASATEDGIAFNYLFDAETFEGMIQEMKKEAAASGIANIEAEVAAGKAMIFTLDGKSHAAPVHGQVNVIVKGNSTVKIMIK